MQNNYDPIAGIYDPLSRLFFFNAQVSAQRSLLPYISENSRILIVGGGTGWILEDLAHLHPSGLTITYVEISQKMLALSEKRDVKNNKVFYVNQAIEDYDLIAQHECIITAFLFDNFSEERASAVFKQLNTGLKQNGLWLFTDFSLRKSSGKYWQRLMLDTMYWFFKKICHVEAGALIDMEPFFEANAYRKVFETYRYGRFIKSIVYKKG